MTHVCDFVFGMHEAFDHELNGLHCVCFDNLQGEMFLIEYEQTKLLYVAQMSLSSRLMKLVEL